MNGEVLVQTNDPHKCAPPLTGGWPIWDPAEPPGTVWRCECGRCYMVKLTRRVSGDRLPEWRRITKRRAHRRLRKAGQA